jgi:predicted aminopeptidase
MPSACRPLAALAALALALLSSGCFKTRYLAQAAYGQFDIGMRARRVADVAVDPSVPAPTRALLGRVAPIKRFGESRGLRATSNYRDFVGLDRNAAVWVVSAAEPLRFKTLSWSFPIAGNVPYLGWFRQDSARTFAHGLRSNGWDVDLRTASAYSTLGWFDDPILSTMLDEGPGALGELANTVLHESLHATLYVGGQTTFNESVASFVGDHMAAEYLEFALGAHSPEGEAYAWGLQAGRDRARALHWAYAWLEALYKSKAPRAEKLAKKAAYLRELRAELGYRRPITNATLAQFKNYHEGSSELAELYEACGRNWGRFLDALRRLGPGSFTEPHQRKLGPVFAPLVSAKCRPADDTATPPATARAAPADVSSR